MNYEPPQNRRLRQPPQTQQTQSAEAGSDPAAVIAARSAAVARNRQQAARAALVEMRLPELDWFMEHCMDSFSMTLDELE